MWVCVWVDALQLLIFASCYTAYKRIVNIMKVYIERNNTQVGLIRFRKNIHQLARGHALPPPGFCGRHDVSNIEKGRSPPGNT